MIGSDGACKTCGKRPGVDLEPPRTPRAPEHKSWWAPPLSAGVAIAFLGVLLWSIGFAWWGASSLLPTTEADAAFLARTSTSTRYVEVVCDQLELAGRFENGPTAYTCATGDRVLPVVGVVESTAPGTTLVGQLHDYAGTYAWPSDLQFGPAATAGYLEVRSRSLLTLRRLAGASGLIGLIAIVAGYVVVRRRRAAIRR